MRREGVSLRKEESSSLPLLTPEAPGVVIAGVGLDGLESAGGHTGHTSSSSPSPLPPLPSISHAWSTRSRALGRVLASLRMHSLMNLRLPGVKQSNSNVIPCCRACRVEE